MASAKLYSRRTALRAALFASAAIGQADRDVVGATSLSEAPLELAGDWGEMLHVSVLRVLMRARRACLDGVRLGSDRQPVAIVIERRSNHPPAIWLQSSRPDCAWTIVDIGERDWSKLAYQFGHELGHVLANSWTLDAKPRAPCQWLEEALVEAFTIRGLGLLGRSWGSAPVFPKDEKFADSIESYRLNIIRDYKQFAVAQGGIDDMARWFADSKKHLELHPELTDAARAASLVFVSLFEQQPKTISALGALNRWTERSALPLARYLSAWIASCRELNLDDSLPRWIRHALLQ